MSAFEITPQFESFLERVKDNPALAPGRGGAPQNARFIPRNFLLEERLDTVRSSSYTSDFPTTGIMDFVHWNKNHNDYLEKYVFVKPPGIHDYSVVARNDPSICPETFRVASNLIPFQGTDLDTHFIRIVPVADLKYLSGTREDRIFSLGEAVVTDLSGTDPARQELSLILEEAYTGSKCDHRPVFVAFYEDFLDNLRDPTDTSWPDKLRDRLGLYRISQLADGGLPLSVFLFRYSVQDVPRHLGDPNHRPLAVPVVLDHRLSEAFCPAPRELNRGRVLNLKANAEEEPAREVLHLFMPMKVEHLFRVGQVTRPVPKNLVPARRDHLIWLRLLTNRDDYASDTDSDLF